MTTPFDLDAAIEAIVTRPGARALDLGCGDGAFARALASRGVRCLAVDRNAIDSADGVSFVESDLRVFEPELGAFDLVVLKNVLQFFAVDDKRTLFRRACAALTPGGLLLVEAFTVDDPSHEALQRDGVSKSGVLSVFERGELRAWAEEDGTLVLDYGEVVAEEDHPPHGRHRHGIAFLAARRVRE
jgi:cyclopropane fatty-acyl-phospholipid synthase-like methyltransferase